MGMNVKGESVKTSRWDFKEYLRGWWKNLRLRLKGNTRELRRKLVRGLASQKSRKRIFRLRSFVTTGRTVSVVWTHAHMQCFLELPIRQGSEDLTCGQPPLGKKAQRED